MKTFTLTITGTSPLLMHNARLSDEFDPIAVEMKKITAKKTKKTEDDRWELRRLEFLGGLYHDEDYGPYIPAQNVEACIKEAARMTRNGKDVERGMQLTTDINPIAYTGPREADALWEDPNHRHGASVKVGMARVIRTRPIFRQWAIEVEGVIDPTILDFDSLSMFTEKAGSFIGLGDWRPRFGRFTTTITEGK